MRLIEIIKPRPAKKTGSRHQQENGSFWQMLDGRTICDMFKHWGATEVYVVPRGQEGGRCVLGCYAIKFPDGWAYAHHSDQSCYASRERYDAPNGRTAWLAIELNSTRESLRYAREKLAKAEAEADAMMSEYCAELAKAMKGAL